MSDIIKRESPKKFGPLKSLRDKIAAKEAQNKALAQALDPKKVPNRIAGILDDSGSTAGDCWNHEIQAFSLLLDQSNFGDTSYLLYKLNEGLVQDLTCNYIDIKIKLANFKSGATPLATAMSRVLHSAPITRAFIVSDGIPDDENGCYMAAELYKEKGIKIDTIFVSSGSIYSGEQPDAKDLMRKIADITGGVFMCFDNLGNFSKAVGYLAPAFRDMLENKKLRLQLGSGE